MLEVQQPGGANKTVEPPWLLSFSRNTKASHPFQIITNNSSGKLVGRMEMSCVYKGSCLEPLIN